MTYRACIFDLDGTLVDSRADIVAAVNAARRALGRKPLSADAVSPHIGGGVRNLLARTLETDDPEHLEEGLGAFRSHYAAHMLDRTAPFPGVEELLDDLEEAGVPLACLSNKLGTFVRAVLDRLEWNGRFRVALGDGDVPAIKPDPRAFDPALEALDSEAGSVLVVGDSTADVEGGRAAGCPTCGVTWGIADPRPANPDHLVETPTEVGELVLGG